MFAPYVEWSPLGRRSRLQRGAAAPFRGVANGWADYLVDNLWNKDGLPAWPFRTDDWPRITAGKN
jgi:hypothetical protein